MAFDAPLKIDNLSRLFFPLISSLKMCIPISVNFGFQSQLNKKCQKSKSSKIRGIPKLDDANDAGGRNSSQCTLILTEGDSAKTLAVSGLSVVGKDHYGVFPLRGKLLNVRDASHKQVWDYSVVVVSHSWGEYTFNFCSFNKGELSCKS